MTMEQHHDLYKAHQKKAMDALKEFNADHSRMDKWNEYRAEQKAANKHWGIEQAMYTKMRKKSPYWMI